MVTSSGYKNIQTLRHVSNNHKLYGNNYLKAVTRGHQAHGSGNQPRINIWKEELGIIVEAASINKGSFYKKKKYHKQMRIHQRTILRSFVLIFLGYLVVLRNLQKIVSHFHCSYNLI